MANLMMRKATPGDATVTVLHSHSRYIREECRQADIIIAAMGHPDFLTADMVKGRSSDHRCGDYAGARYDEEERIPFEWRREVR